MPTFELKRALLLAFLVLLADQALKVWVKLSFHLGESLSLCGRGCHWAYLQFVENRGMAFGMEFGGDTGKVTLTLFRIVAVVGIGYLMVRSARRQGSTRITTSLALVFAGALGNIIDSTFYGVLFSASLPYEKAVFLPADGGYSSLLHGAVVDMFYFPIWHGHFPQWFPVWGGQEFEFFRPVFNIADAAITIGIVMLLLSQRHEEKRERARRAAMDAAPVEEIPPPVPQQPVE